MSHFSPCCQATEAYLATAGTMRATSSWRLNPGSRTSAPAASVWRASSAATQSRVQPSFAPGPSCGRASAALIASVSASAKPTEGGGPLDSWKIIIAIYPLQTTRHCAQLNQMSPCSPPNPTLTNLPTFFAPGSFSTPDSVPHAYTDLSTG